MNCLMASFVMPRSLRDCSDQSLGSFQPWYTPDLTSCAPFDFEILTPSIEASPLYIDSGFGQSNIFRMKSWTRVDM